jgi:hypothetical protein
LEITYQPRACRNFARTLALRLFNLQPLGNFLRSKKFFIAEGELLRVAQKWPKWLHWLTLRSKALRAQVLRSKT